MKKILVIALIVGVAAIFVNDLGAYVGARRDLVEGARDAANAAAGTGGSRDAAARAAAEAAHARGAEVYLYNQDGSRVEVWARIPIEGTIAYGPIRSLIAGDPFSTVPLLEYYETTPVR